MIEPTIWAQIPLEEIQRLMHESWEHGIKQQFDGNESTRKVWKVALPATCVRLTGLGSVDIESYVTLVPPSLGSKY